jgi:hypothetical protein
MVPGISYLNAILSKDRYLCTDLHARYNSAPPRNHNNYSLALKIAQYNRGLKRMLSTKKFFILVIAIMLFGIGQVTASPWDNFARLDQLNSYQKIYDLSPSSFTSPYNSISDPLMNTKIQPISNSLMNTKIQSINDPLMNPNLQSPVMITTPPINPFMGYNSLSSAGSLGKIPSTSSYDYAIDDQMRQMKYSTDIATQNRIMNTMAFDTKLTAGTNAVKSVYDVPVSLDAQYDSYGNPASIKPVIEVDSLAFNAIDPTGTLGRINGISKDQFKYIGYSTQIMSPPALKPSDYQIRQLGPYGVLGGDATGFSTIQNNNMKITTYDSFNTMGMSQLDHYYAQRVDFNNLGVSPGVTATGSSWRMDSFHTPLQSGPAGWALSRGSTMYPITGFDPSTDFGTSRIGHSITYNVNINPGISNYNTIPKVNYNTYSRIGGGINNF